MSYIAELVNAIAPRYNLDPKMVACVILQESNLDTFAARFEQGIYNKLVNRSRIELGGHTMPHLETEKILRATSFGLMQVLGDTARWLCRLEASPVAMCDPAVGIECGCKVLAYYTKRAGGDTRGGLVGYNGSQKYADEVMNRFNNREFLRVF